MDGNAQVSASVSSNMPYAVEAATNLLGSNSWIRVVTNSSASNVLIYVDIESTNFIRRFYRLVPDP